MSKSPGTVSKILWHFTGGGKQIGDDPNERSEPKPVNEAVNTLYKIMQGSYLKASNDREIFKVNRIKYRIDDDNGRKELLSFYDSCQTKTSQVVCLAEIPIQHLHFHAHRYGKVAIGFHRRSVFFEGFNPVAYLSDYSKVARAVSFIHAIASALVENPLQALNLTDFPCSLEDRENLKYEISNCGEFLSNETETIMSNIKSFTENEFDSIYCEREWRATHDFHFGFDAVAMIVLPSAGGYLDKFIEDHPLIPRYVPIVSWEDLIEH